MFCRNCGNQMQDTEKFCANCGAESTAPSGAGTLTGGALGEKEINKYIGIAVSVIAVIMLFLDWVKIPVLSLLGQYGVSSMYNLFEVFNFADFVQQYSSGNTDGLYFVAVLFIGLLIVTLIGYGLFIYKLFKDYDKSTSAGNFAFIMSIVMPVVVYITIFIVNASIKDQTSGFVSSVISATGVPIFMIIIGAAGMFFISRMKKEIYNRRMGKE